MATVHRLKTAKEGWFQVAKRTYFLLALPCLLLLGLLSLMVLPGSMPGRETKDTLILIAMFWTPVVVPVLLLVSAARARRKLLNKILNSLKTKDVFWPEEGQELLQVSSGKYLGIDAKNGTILYVHRIRKGQVDVVGMTMGDWTNRELEGSVLRLYTKYPELPCIEISTPWAQRWYDTLGAMEYKRYQSATLFKKYVIDHIETLERDNKIQIPQLA